MYMIIYPNVAGKFYPADPEVLRHDILQLLADNRNKLSPPKAIIAPHAGYIYSGPTAAAAYECLRPAQQITHVVLLAPAHRYPVNGIVTTQANYYLTPLGQIAIGQNNVTLPYFQVCEEAFMHEHAIEVHLPFLQLTLKNFTLVPLLVGIATAAQVTTVLEKFWDGPETLIIISSDLSHYLPYTTAKNLDAKTAAAICKLAADELVAEQACGVTAIQGLLNVATKKNMQVTQIDLRNSGDTAGPKDQVVGYGAFHFTER